MSAVRRFFQRLTTLFSSRKAEADLAREVESHLQLLEDKFQAQGMSVNLNGSTWEGRGKFLIPTQFTVTTLK